MGEPLLHALAVNLPTGGVVVLAYLALGSIIGLESMGIPLPGETPLIAAAYLASRGELSLTWVIVAAATGAIIGDSIGYTIGRRAGRSIFDRLGRRWHHFSPGRIAKAEHYFHKYGVWTVFSGRFVALLRILAVPMAGTLRMPYPRFLAANAAGGIVWATLISIVTYKIGDHAGNLFGRLSIWALVAAACVAAYVAFRIRRRRHTVGQPDAETVHAHPNHPGSVTEHDARLAAKFQRVVRKRFPVAIPAIGRPAYVDDGTTNR